VKELGKHTSFGEAQRKPKSFFSAGFLKKIGQVARQPLDQQLATDLSRPVMASDFRSDGLSSNRRYRIPQSAPFFECDFIGEMIIMILQWSRDF